MQLNITIYLLEDLKQRLATFKSYHLLQTGGVEGPPALVIFTIVSRVRAHNSVTIKTFAFHISVATFGISMLLEHAYSPVH